MTNQFCPTGNICINNYNAIGIVFVGIILIYLFNKNVYLNIYNKFLENNNKQDNNMIHSTHSQSDTIQMVNTANNAQPQLYDMDRGVISDPLHPPLSRNYYTDPNGIVAVRDGNINQQYQSHQHRQLQQNQGRNIGVPINIETRESGGDFQQVGMISKKIINDDTQVPGNNTDTNILPLYGKPLYRGSNKWMYYTETDKHNPVKIPITVNSRDCTDDQGCDELSDSSEVLVPSYNGNFIVKMYKFNKPRYIPIQNPRDIMPLPFT